MTSYIPKILEIFGKRHIYPFRFSRVSLINRFKISKIFQKRHIYPSSYILIDPCSASQLDNWNFFLDQFGRFLLKLKLFYFVHSEHRWVTLTLKDH